MTPTVNEIILRGLKRDLEEAVARDNVERVLIILRKIKRHEQEMATDGPR